ncbi:MAG: Nudix family hydrolase [Pseudomonadota bacterium]
MPSIAPEAALALPDYHDYLHVVVAVIDNGCGEVLITKRHEHLHQGGLWEFPGGKVDAGEVVYSALSRELHEELAIVVQQAHPLIRIPYHYPERKVLLDVWRVTAFCGEPIGAEGQPLMWVKKQDLRGYEFPSANSSIITAAQLPSRYLITPEPGLESEWPDFLRLLRRALDDGISLLQLRAISLSRDDYMKLAQQVLVYCQEHGARLLLNADITSLEECDAAGVHLNSRRLMAVQKRPVTEDKLLAASCHSLKELQHAECIGVDFALLSPVKATTSHPGTEAMGWHNFHCLSEQTELPLFALGGMSPEDLPDAWRYGAQGIAAIRSLFLTQ